MVAPPDALFQWHMRPGAFERLTPPWADVGVPERRGEPSHVLGGSTAR